MYFIGIDQHKQYSESNHVKSNRRYNVLSFKNLTEKEEKISHNNSLVLLERRLGYEKGVTDGICRVSL